MNKFFLRLRLIWFFIKAVFGTKIEGLDNQAKETQAENVIQDNSAYGAYQLKRFLELYNLNAEDKIDYTNTHQDHSTNFRHLDPKGTWREQEGDKPNEALKMLEIAGLIYEEDGKTPKNAAEVFDMTYEEYTVYKAKILPIARERTIKFEDVKEFIEDIRK